MTEFSMSVDQENEFNELADFVSKTAKAAYETLLWSEGVSEGSEIHSSVVVEVFIRVSDFLWSDAVRLYIDLYELSPEFVGHNFILSGNGHGAGFKDSGEYPSEVGEWLHRQSTAIEMYADDYGAYYVD